jgi:hypothetical protein
MTSLASHTLLTTILVGPLLPADIPECCMLRGWLDTWVSVGHILDAMSADGYYVELLRVLPRGHAPFTYRPGQGRRE